MPTPNKPAVVIRAEGRSHRTKAELELREKGEAALATGEPMKARKEVKANKKANSEFKRVSKLLEGIGKNDALIEGVINRYCQITAEVLEFEEKREDFSKGISQLQEAYEDDALANPDNFDKLKNKAADMSASKYDPQIEALNKDFIARVNAFLETLPGAAENTGVQTAQGFILPPTILHSIR